MAISDQTYRIVRATREQLPRVVELMRGLAEFEDLLDEFRVTEELLARHLMGPQPAAELLVGFLGDEICGYAIYFHNFSSFQGRPGVYLEDVYVEPSARGRGLGKALLLEVLRAARESGCQRCEWIVLDWNERAKQFYESLGANVLNDWRLCRIEADAMRQLSANERRENSMPNAGDG